MATSGCVTKKFVRNTVNTSADALSARIETTEGEIKEIRDSVDQKVAGVNQRINGVDTRVSALDEKTATGMTSLKTELKGDVQNADQHAVQAQSSADRAATNVSALDQRFQNRNQFNVANEKSIQFKFDSAKLDKQYMDVLDEVASALLANPNALVVLEGRTDSTGDREYNVKLGERRIDAVRRYLAVDKGVPIYRIHEISFGPEKPIAENKTRDGREKNRAVTMTLMVPKAEGTVASRNE